MTDKVATGIAFFEFTPLANNKNASALLTLHRLPQS